eukprot:s2_g8.t4
MRPHQHRSGRKRKQYTLKANRTTLVHRTQGLGLSIRKNTPDLEKIIQCLERRLTLGILDWNVSVEAFRCLEQARDVAAGTLLAHGFDPPWMFPTVNELKCKLGYGCDGSGPIQSAAQKAAEAAEEQAKIQSSKLAMTDFDADGRYKGPPGWPYGVVKKVEKAVWTPKDVEELRAKLPKYKIKGSLVAAKVVARVGWKATAYGCWKFAGAYGRWRRPQIFVTTWKNALTSPSPWVQNTPALMIGPHDSHEDVREPLGVPYRAEFCRGPMVTILDDTNSHSFVGIKKTWVRDHGLPPPKMIPRIPLPDQPLEAYGRDARYYRSMRANVKKLEEAKKLDRLQSEANQLTAIQKKEQAEGVKAQLKSMEQLAPLIGPAPSEVSQTTILESTDLVSWPSPCGQYGWCARYRQHRLFGRQTGSAMFGLPSSKNSPVNQMAADSMPLDPFDPL